MVMAVLFLGVASTAQAQVVSLNQNFEGTTAPGWVGRLGLHAHTDGDHRGEPGLARDDQRRRERVDVRLRHDPLCLSEYDHLRDVQLCELQRDRADGLTFFLANASVLTSGFTPGAYGGSLGYAQKTGINGLSGGYLGIGVDEFGNYSNPTEGRVGGTGFVPNAIAVRGPGSGTSGYNYLGGTSSLAGALSYPASTSITSSEVDTIQMVLTSTNQLTVSIAYGGSSVFQTFFTANLSAYTRPRT